MAVEKLEIETYFGKCKCCLKFGYLRPMWDENEDEHEVYGKMLTQCFSIPWTIEISEEDDQICEDCIWKLQEANKFKQQILNCRSVCTQDQKIEVVLEEIKSEPEEAYDVEYLDEDLLHKNVEDSANNEQNGDYDADYLEDIETLDDDDENHDGESDKSDLDEDDDDEEYKESEAPRPTSRKRTSRRRGAATEADTPKSKWPKKLPLEDRWKTYRQYTDDDMKLAIDEVMNKTMSQRQAALKFNVPVKTLSAKIRAIKNNEEVTVYRNETSTFAAEMKILLSYLNVTPFRNRAAVTFCYYCSERHEFDSPQDMKAHTRLQHPDQPDKIEVALRPSWTNELVKLDIHDLKCVVCDEKLTWIQTFTHLEEKHATSITYKNKLLPFDLSTDYKCVLCSESFISITQLDWHMNKHYPNYICGHCGEPFASLARFRAHERTHNTGRYPCTLCNKEFSLQKYMTKHVALKHMKVKKIKCFYCNEAFVTEYNRQAHITKDHSEHVQVYTCEVCGETFDWLRTFTRHMTRRHSTQFYCKICSKSFMSSKALEYHNTIHNGDSYECPVCQRCYSSFNTLKSHVKFSHKNQPSNVKGIFGIQ